MKKTKLSWLLAGLALALASQTGIAHAESSVVLAVEFQGPGGHSNGAYGRTNAVHAAGRTLAAIAAAQNDKSTYNITGFNGGNSVNSIASDARYKIRLRAASDSALETLKSQITASIEKGVKAENDFRGVKTGDMTGGVPAEIRVSITAEPPAKVKPVVEFYHAAFDHYFITQNTQEIADLDNGVHKGWQRTGQTFNAYEPGSSDSKGTAICRFYGLPAAGLDSHFYPAPGEKCGVSAEAAKAWLKETDNAFEVLLPESSSACPTGTTPIYRFWNNRADSNHRYVTTNALASAMRDKGYVYEGPGWMLPIMCSSPATP